MWLDLGSAECYQLLLPTIDTPFTLSLTTRSRGSVPWLFLSIDRACSCGATTRSFRFLCLIMTKMTRSTNNMSKMTPITMPIIVHIVLLSIDSADGDAVVVPSVADVEDSIVLSGTFVVGEVGSVGSRLHSATCTAEFKMWIYSTANRLFLFALARNSIYKMENSAGFTTVVRSCAQRAGYLPVHFERWRQFSCWA